ncbi:MAG: ABC transporter permease [Hyphomicrobiaceae bacterium]
MTVLRLALQSLGNRWITALVTIFAIAVSVMLLLGVEKIRTGARASFANTISGTDVIVGARSGDIQLLLYSVFRIGNAPNNMTWRSYEQLTARKNVAWSVPMSLGDSHQGFRVLGTTKEYFEHYRYRDKRKLPFLAGGPFAEMFDAVIGADVAKELGYTLNDPIVVSHGIGEIGASEHDNMPFRVAGILGKTGTPVDRTVHVTLGGIEAIHLGWKGGAKNSSRVFTSDEVRNMDLKPKAITAALFGLKSRFAVFKFQRYVNTYRAEALSAVLPGVALTEMWSLVGTAETALFVVSIMVVVTALLGMVAMIFATLNERRREMAILRSVGAGPKTVVGLLSAEALIMTLAGIALGIALLYGVLIVVRPYLDSAYGIFIDISLPSHVELWSLAAIILGGVLAGLIPAWRAYRNSLADGMMVRT